MIISFSVSNFRSFDGEETFSLVASNRISGSHENHVMPIPGTSEKALRTAVLYGANCAGKSNLFKALNYLKSMVLEPRPKRSGTGREAFRFGFEKDQPSVFDLRFMVGGQVYRYGLKVDDQKVLEEWLVWVDGGREKELYERITDEKGRVIIDVKGVKSVGEKLEAMATVGGPQNQTFLATVKGNLDPSGYGEELQNVLNWFEDGLHLVAPQDSFIRLGLLLANDKAFLEFASDFLKSSSTGVDRITISKKEITEDQLRNLITENTYSNILKEIENEGHDIFPLWEDTELLVERTDKIRFFLFMIQAAHKYQSSETPLELAEESDGTRRLLHLLPALFYMQKTNTVFFVDEIDRSMHPILVKKFMEFFLKSCGGRNSQVIVTTHESNLLDLDLLRRDEIWFAEKDQAGATKLYSLSDFKVRKDLEIRKHYLQGRFGAVPFLGNLEG